MESGTQRRCGQCRRRFLLEKLDSPVTMAKPDFLGASGKINSLFVEQLTARIGGRYDLGADFPRLR